MRLMVFSAGCVHNASSSLYVSDYNNDVQMNPIATFLMHFTCWSGEEEAWNHLEDLLRTARTEQE